MWVMYHSFILNFLVYSVFVSVLIIKKKCINVRGVNILNKFGSAVSDHVWKQAVHPVRAAWRLEGSCGGERSRYCM